MGKKTKQDYSNTLKFQILVFKKVVHFRRADPPRKHLTPRRPIGKIYLQPPLNQTTSESRLAAALSGLALVDSIDSNIYHSSGFSRKKRHCHSQPKRAARSSAEPSSAPAGPTGEPPAARRLGRRPLCCVPGSSLPSAAVTMITDHSHEGF